MFNQIFQAVTDLGLWKENKWNGISCFGKCSLILCYLGVYILQWKALVSSDNIEQRLKCFSVLFFCGMGILKLFSLYFRSEDWLKLLKQITKLEEQLSLNNNHSAVEYESEDEDLTSDLVKKNQNYVEESKTTFMMLRRIYNFTAVIFILSPFVEYGFRSLLSNKPAQFPHILPCFTPFDEANLIWYILMIALEAIAAVSCVYAHIAYDVTVIGMLIFLGGRFTILFDQCTRIGGRGRKFTLSRRRNERAHHRIVVYCKTHILLVNAMKRLNSLIKDVLGVFFIVSTFTLCYVAIQLKTKNMSFMTIVSLLLFTCGTLTQLFLFCFYGDAVSNTSSVNMGEGPHAAAVWSLSPKIRKEILLLSVGMSMPRRLNAGPFNVVNLRTFLKIVLVAFIWFVVVGKK